MKRRLRRATVAQFTHILLIGLATYGCLEALYLTKTQLKDNLV